MLRSRLQRLLGRVNTQPLSHRFFSAWSRRLTASTPPPPPEADRIQRILRRTPKFLRPTLSALHNAPLTHITAFLILHEITAIAPLVGLVGAFHYFQWLPPFFAEGKWVVSGVEKFGNYFRRKGWIEAGDTQEAKVLAESGKAGTVERVKQKKGVASKWWGRGETGTRLLVEVATAYAVVKVLLPLRLIVSVWGAPWFARWTVVPFNNMVKGLFKRRAKQVGTGGKGTVVNATGTKAANVEKVTK
jgi:Hypothetical protein FLILHELTA